MKAGKAQLNTRKINNNRSERSIKRKEMRKLLLIAVIAAVAAAGCKKDNKEKDKQVEYTVTFDADGGTPVPPKQTVEAGEMATAPNSPAKAGYVFMFWSLNGANTAYNFQTPVTGDITLIAKWQAEATVEYWQVSWNLNGGAWAASYTPPAQVVKGGTLAEPTEPTKASNILEGWYKEAALTNKVTFPYDVSGVTADFTLYAKWETNEAQLSVSPNEAILFTKDGGAKTIAVTTNQASWSAVSSETWCVVAKGTNQFTVTVATYTGASNRTATITVKAGNASNVTLSVTQAVEPNIAFVARNPVTESIYTTTGFFNGSRINFDMIVYDAAGMTSIKIEEEAMRAGYTTIIKNTRIIPISGPGTYQLSQEMLNANVYAAQITQFTYTVKAYGKSYTRTYSGNYVSSYNEWSHSFGIK